MSIRSLGESVPKPLPPTASVSSTQPDRVVAKTTDRSPFAQVIDGLGKEINSGERMMRNAIDGGGASGMEPAQLLALQAGVYRYGEVVDLASKLIDRTSSGVKTVIGGGQ